jgi:hypothetical protein
MKTTSRWFHLRGLFLSSVAFCGGLALCGSAIAGPTMYREATPYQESSAQQKPTHKRVVYFVLTSASAIPRPISYVIGGIMTTPTPIQIIGRGETVNR